MPEQTKAHLIIGKTHSMKKRKIENWENVETCYFSNNWKARDASLESNGIDWQSREGKREQKSNIKKNWMDKKVEQNKIKKKKIKNCISMIQHQRETLSKLFSQWINCWTQNRLLVDNLVREFILYYFFIVTFNLLSTNLWIIKMNRQWISIILYFISRIFREISFSILFSVTDNDRSWSWDRIHFGFIFFHFGCSNWMQVPISDANLL